MTDPNPLWVEVIRWTAVVVMVSMYVPQVIRARRDASGVSARTWLSAAAGAAVWLVYGVTRPDIAFVVLNAPITVMALLIALPALKLEPHEIKLAGAWSMVVVVAAVSGQWVGSGAAGAIGFAVSAWVIAPQVFRVTGDPESATGVSAVTWSISVLARLLWIAYALATSQPWVVATAAVALIGSLAIVVRLRAARSGLEVR